jgi:hypothetical protein
LSASDLEIANKIKDAGCGSYKKQIMAVIAGIIR